MEKNSQDFYGMAAEYDEAVKRGEAQYKKNEPLTKEEITMAVAPWPIGLAAGVLRRRKLSRKQCPDCAESVRIAANVCKHCGHRFADQAEQT